MAHAVQTKRPELAAKLAQYTMIEDALAGQEAVKAKKTDYLPRPNEIDPNSEEALARYTAYLTRAVYYNVIEPTREALVGQLFLRPLKCELPESMQPMLDDMNGEGLSAEEVVRQAANHVLPYGRGGFLTDFPRTGGEVTQADLENGVRPTIKFFSPWTILNWRVRRVGNRHKLVMLVLQEATEKANTNNQFAVEVEHQYRVYKLSDSGQVTLEMWDEDHEGPIETLTINGQDGQPLDEIPFEFIGSRNNDVDVDEPPLYGLAVLNLAHYRNSADYEESCFMVGQPTPVFAGLTDDWVESHFDKGIVLGARGAVPLPEGGKGSLMQAEPNTLAFEAMTHKEDQMIAIGAKIIRPQNNVERKEEEIKNEVAGQRSILMTIRNNIQSAFLKSLERAAAFVGASPDEIEAELNDNFDLSSMTAEEIRWQIELFTKRMIPYKDVHENLRRSGLVKGTPEESQDAIKKDQAFIDSVTPEPTQPTSPNPTNEN